LFFGVALAAYPKKEKKQVFLDSLGTFNDIIMKIINYVMAVAPIGIGVLLAATIGQKLPAGKTVKSNFVEQA
jgi:Na+/H+-dicarboxylate symporter